MLNVLTGYQYFYITAPGTYQIFKGKGVLHFVILNNTAAGMLKIIDGKDGTEANVAILRTELGTRTEPFDIIVTDGLRIISDNDSNITITYQKE
jgi:hypothetical protein